MTHEADIERMNYERTMANLLTPEPRKYNVLLVVLPAAVLGIGLFLYATNVLWVRQ